MRLITPAFIAPVLIALAAAPSAHAGNYGAIDCTKAKAADEVAICKTTELIQLDAQMSTEYGLMKGLLPMGGRGAMMDDQVDWLKARKGCKADTACLRKAYNDRIAVLEKLFDRVKGQGPF